jgi:hypothetical protein
LASVFRRKRIFDPLSMLTGDGTGPPDPHGLEFRVKRAERRCQTTGARVELGSGRSRPNAYGEPVGDDYDTFILSWCSRHRSSWIMRAPSGVIGKCVMYPWNSEHRGIPSFNARAPVAMTPAGRREDIGKKGYPLVRPGARVPSTEGTGICPCGLFLLEDGRGAAGAIRPQGRPYPKT